MEGSATQSPRRAPGIASDVGPWATIEWKAEIVHRIMLILGAALLLTGLLAACEAEEAEEAEEAPDGEEDAEAGDPDPVELTLVTALEEDAAEHTGLWMYVEALEEEAPWITIDYVGGPEVVGSTESTEAVSTGQYDLTDNSPAYYTDILPAAEALLMRNAMPSEERADGTFEVMQEYFDEINLQHLGTTLAANSTFMLYLGERGEEFDPEDPDFTGWQIRGGAQYRGLVQALGGEMVDLDIGDTYTAMERGTVDGFGAGKAGVYALGLADVVSYEIHPDFKALTYQLLMNQDTWNELDAETQQVMTEVLEDLEPEIVEMWDEVVEDELAQRREDGIELIELEGEARETWLDAAYEASWEAALEADPSTEQLKDLWGYDF